MFTRVVGAAVRAGLGGTVVVTADGETARLADELGARVLVEGGGGLNPAVRQGLAWAEGRARGALVLPADLPLLEPEEVLGVLAAAPAPPCAVICPSQDGGTNALLLCPASALEPAYGPGSAERHAAAAQAAGLRVARYTSPGLAFDIDSLEDLAALASRHG